jgi:hypothetical protein
MNKIISNAAHLRLVIRFLTQMDIAHQEWTLYYELKELQDIKNILITEL